MDIALSHITLLCHIVSISFKLTSALYAEMQNMFQHLTVFTIRVQRRTQVKRADCALWQTKESSVNRSYDAYICSSCSCRYHTQHHAYNCCFDFVFLIETCMTTMHLGSKNFRCAVSWLCRHNDRCSYCFDILRIVNWF